MSSPVDKTFLIETEQELGFEFPESYRNKLSKENGWETNIKGSDWNFFPILDRSDNKRIKRTCNHVVLETKQAKTWIGFPDNGIAIAKNDYGDYLVLLPLNTDDKKLGEQIYLWLHETEQLNLLANSINELT